MTTKSVLIVGMHRSGTSALAGVLGHAGVDLGRTLLSGREDNPRGFFEHAEIFPLHQALLTSLGSEWNDLCALPAGWQQSEAAQRFTTDLSRIVERDFAGAPLWAVKDPRMSRLFDLWPPEIQSIGAEARAILTLRHPMEVARSLARRNGMEIQHGLGLWLRYVLDAERATRPWPRALQHYPDLLANWAQELERLDAALGLGLPARTPDQNATIADFIDRGLHHQHSLDDWARADRDPVSGWCDMAYRAMLAGLNDGSAASLDAIAAEFDAWERSAGAIRSQVAYCLAQNHERDGTIRWLEGQRVLHEETIHGLAVEHDRVAEERRLERAAYETERLSQSESMRLLEDERRVLWGERQTLWDERAALLQRVEETESLRRQKETDLVRADRKIEQLNTQVTGLQTALEAVHRSTSWRLTAPLRSTAKFLRGAKRKPDGAPPAASLPLAPPQPQPQTGDSGKPAERQVAAPRSAFKWPSRSPQILPSRRPTQHARVLIVTPDIHGPIRNGGIGTAFSALAIWLARWGYEASVLYALGDYTETEPVAHWQKYYADLGVHLIPLNPEALGDMPELQGSQCGQMAWKVHSWLRTREQLFDLVIFAEWMGLAYYVLLTKGQGLAYRGLPVAVNAHSPENWALEGNRALPDSNDMLEREFMERESVRRADWLISPSEYMFDWMQEHRWQIPARRMVIQNLLGEPSCQDEQGDGRAPVTELVFFGRLEFRKGLKLFCDAIERLSDAERARVGRIVFMGKASMVVGYDSARYIELRSADWNVPVEIRTDLNREQALEYLTRPGILAIIASLSENSPYTVLECLHHRICFLATSVGGIPELVHEVDRWHSLFDPNPSSLAQRIAGALEHGAVSARMAVPQEQTRAMWSAWLEQATENKTASDAVGNGQSAESQPFVSLCLVHYERPAMLAQALESLREQSYRNFEVVLVDDGSPSEAAQAFLDSLEPEFELRGWTIIRQPNQYLGAARNRAAQAAGGAYLLFMDDDNIAMPDELAVFVQAALHSGADILTCVAHIFHGEGVPIKTDAMWLPLGGAPGPGLYRNVFGDANALWKRETFLALGGYTTDYGVGHEDWELFAKAVLSGLRLETVPEPLFWYRIHPGSMLRTGDFWADHARSARAYVRHDPSGMGLASAFGVCLLQSRIASMNVNDRRDNAISGWQLAANAVRLAFSPKYVVRFFLAWNHHGLRHALRKSVTRSRIRTTARQEIRSYGAPT